MSEYNFLGIYAPYIKQLVELKQKIGYKYTSASELLLRFDRFTVKRQESVVGITKELSEAWCEKQGCESDKYHCEFLRKPLYRIFIPMMK